MMSLVQKNVRQCMPCSTKFSVTLQTEILSTKTSDFPKQITFTSHSVLYEDIIYQYHSSFLQRRHFIFNSSWGSFQSLRNFFCTNRAATAMHPVSQQDIFHHFDVTLLQE